MAVVGVLVADVLLGDVHTLKQKRSVVRPIVAELARKYSVSASETGEQDVYRRCEISAAFVSGERSHVVEVLDSCERLVAGRPEIELLATRVRVLDDDDLD